MWQSASSMIVMAASSWGGRQLIAGCKQMEGSCNEPHSFEITWINPANTANIFQTPATRPFPFPFSLLFAPIPVHILRRIVPTNNIALLLRTYWDSCIEKISILGGRGIQIHGLLTASVEEIMCLEAYYLCYAQ